MRYNEIVADIIARYLGEGHTGYHIHNIDGRLIYIEGHNGLNEIKADEISYKVSKKIVVIKGNNISIKEMDNNTAIISGIITSIEVL